MRNRGEEKSRMSGSQLEIRQRVRGKNGGAGGAVTRGFVARPARVRGGATVEPAPPPTVLQ